MKKSQDIILEQLTSIQKENYLSERKRILKQSIIIFPILLICFIGLTIFMGIFLNLSILFECISFIFMIVLTFIVFIMFIKVIVEKYSDNNVKILSYVKSIIRFSKLNKKIVFDNNDKIIKCPNGLFSKIKIGFNNQGKIVSFYYSKNKVNSYSYYEIIRCNIIAGDKQAIQDRTLETLIGGVILGPIGAMAGANMEREIKQYSTHIYLSIETVNQKHPEVLIMLSNRTLLKGSEQYNNVVIKAAEIKQNFDQIINNKYSQR